MAKRTGGMTPADFRRVALSFEGAEEGSHMGAAAFRVGGRIFATLASQAQGYGNLMLTPAGSRKAERFASDAALMDNRATGGLSGRERADLLRLLEKLSARVSSI